MADDEASTAAKISRCNYDHYKQGRLNSYISGSRNCKDGDKDKLNDNNYNASSSSSSTTSASNSNSLASAPASSALLSNSTSMNSHGHAQLILLQKESSSTTNKIGGDAKATCTTGCKVINEQHRNVSTAHGQTTTIATAAGLMRGRRNQPTSAATPATCSAHPPGPCHHQHNQRLFVIHRAFRRFLMSCRLPSSASPLTRRRLHFEPSHKLYFPYQPGKQSRSAVRIKNVSTSAVAFKFQTTAPRSCFMRPPNGVLLPGESIVATVFKFIELNISSRAPQELAAKTATRNKFKIVSLMLQDGVEFTQDLFEAQKEAVVVEQVLQVILLNPAHPSPQLQALNALLSEADAAHYLQRKSQAPNPIFITSMVDALEEWKQQKLARESKQPNGRSVKEALIKKCT